MLKGIILLDLSMEEEIYTQHVRLDQISDN